MKIILLLFIVSSFPALAKVYTANSQICYSADMIPSLSDQKNCVGLVADDRSIPWTMPRKILFIKPDVALVTALGSWKKNQGQIWQLNFSQGKLLNAQLIFANTDRSHGIRQPGNTTLKQNSDSWIYYADATAIYRFKLADPTSTRQIVIDNLHDSYKDRNGKITASSHPLKEFIFLENNDIIVNIGAPSNDCSEEFKTFRSCQQRDEQAELRRYIYDATTDTYFKNYYVVARGLRNSMGLLWNPDQNTIYQAENASDQPGTPDEINVIDPSLLANSQDYGWPFCYADKNLYPGYNNFRSFCNSTALSPIVLLPAHAAPLDMLYYKGRMFPELQNYILMSWHGHRPTGSRIAAFKTDEQLNFHSDYGIANSQAEEPEQLITSAWAKSTNDHPKGRPTGVGVNGDGAIFILDDVNHSLLVLARNDPKIQIKPTNLNPPPKSDPIAKLLSMSEAQLSAWQELDEKVLKPLECMQCHSDIFNPDSTVTLKNLLLNEWLNLDSKNLSDQRLWVRMTGHEGARIMPPSPAPTVLADPQGLKNLENWITSF